MAMDDSLVEALTRALGGAVVQGALIDREQWASDASIYRLVPRVVVLVRSAEDVQAVLGLAAEHGAPVCFRAGGTSLSGQAVTDGILVVVSRHLRSIRVIDSGQRVSCAPGAVGAWVNAALAPYQRRIGPDPASMQAAEIGGIVANNASGMCCGVAENSYHTVDGLELMLADGYRIDTAAADADVRLARDRPAIAAGLLELRDLVRGDAHLSARIGTAFATKNTVGYSLNAFLDAETPARILQRLVVGSEGTLAFISNATFRTLPLPGHRATAWLMFSTLDDACSAVKPLAQLGAAAIELLDAVALARVEGKLPHVLPAGEPTALLVEFQETTAEALRGRIGAATPVLLGFDLAAPAAFTGDTELQHRYWTIRKGLFPSVGAVRASGTAVVIEDVTFPVDELAAGVRSLRACFSRYGFDDAVIFGHAKDGNLHFTLTPDFAKTDQRERYDRFMHGLVDCVLAAGGHLKAEHGTGRNMAPFVTRQWGEDAVALMRRVKALLDPCGRLNPGVLLSDDPQAHVRHLKTLPAVDPLVDQCIECGFCEPVCPSRDLTYSPRQRIAALRTLVRGGPAAEAVRAGWQERGLDSCAADGMCSSVCPVHINTGDLVNAERAARRGQIARMVAATAASHVSFVTASVRLALATARLFGVQRLPGARIRLPAPAPRLPRRWPLAEQGGESITYLPSCLARTLGDDALPQLLLELCAAAGIGVAVPADADALCCGQPFASKGFPLQAELAAHQAIEAALGCGAEDGRMVVGDTSTCSAQLERASATLAPAAAGRWSRVRQLHPAAFAMRILIPRLQARGRLHPGALELVLHPTCSEHLHGWTEEVAQAAQAASSRPVYLPDAAGCCGMAGDKGWSLPALTAAATVREAEQACGRAATGGVSTSASCAAAMSAATGLPYRHLFAHLVAALR